MRGLEIDYRHSGLLLLQVWVTEPQEESPKRKRDGSGEGVLGSEEGPLKEVEELQAAKTKKKLREERSKSNQQGRSVGNEG